MVHSLHIETDDTYAITEVTSVISHQLKTPLSVIKSSLEVILSGELGTMPQEQTEYVVIALDNTKRMIALVKDFLDASRIDEGRFELHSERADLKKTVEEVLRDLAPFIQAKLSKVSFEPAGDVPLLSFDAMKIRQVIDNLLYNAVRYNKGKSEIIVRLEKKENEVIFSCKDNGSGISTKDKDKIFKKFYRGKSAIKLATEGSGLGLYISKAIIEQSGGRIWFESEENKGSVFYFSLPL